MKNLKNFLVLAFLVALLAIAGCTKPNNPPVPIPAAPKLTVFAPAGAIPYADSVNFSWQTTGKVASVTLDGKAVSPSGSHNTGRLLVDQDYELRAVGPGGADSKTIAIKVGDWTTSTFGLLTHGSWLFDSTGYKTQNMDSFYMYTHDEVNPAYYIDQYYYLTTGKYITKNKNTGATISEHSWELLPSDTIVIAGGEKRGIEIITKTKMVLIETVGSPQGPALLKTVYKRDTSK